MISIQILIENDEKHISRLLDSIGSIDAEVIIANVGSKDNTVEICKSRGYDVLSFVRESDLSKVRNTLTDMAANKLNLFIEPWEVLTNPLVISDLKSKVTYNADVFKSGIITKEARLWDKELNIKFKSPVFEYLDTETDTDSGILIYSDGEFRNNHKRILDWKKSCPTKQEPIYYEAISYLQRREWDNFANTAKKYLFETNVATESTLIIKYYYSTILCHVKKDATQAIKNILECILIKPCIAEFWCLLGDIYYYLLKDYTKSKQFYLNAIELGKHRLNGEVYPMEISKYKSYPTKMIENCSKLLANNLRAIL